MSPWRLTRSIDLDKYAAHTQTACGTDTSRGSKLPGVLERTRKQKQADARLLIAGLGASKRVDHLTNNDVERYVAMRRTGVGWPEGRKATPVRGKKPRSAKPDVLKDA